MDIRIQDDARLFDAADMHRLTSAQLPFELHVLTTSAPTRAALEARVHDSIDGPNVVGIGVDPTHHWVIAHFGVGTGVPSSQWSAIVSSGNADLHDARWVDGVLAIARSAEHARTQTAVAMPAHEEPSSEAGVFIAAGFVIVVVAALALLVRRARPRAAAVRRRGAYGGPYRSSGRKHVGVTAREGSTNDLLTGYVIGSAMQPSPVVDHHVTHTTPTFDAGTSFGGGGGGGFDGGGAGSSF